ncbi:ABC transporter substrate-binding protein [Bifidobacterium magnum]|uniref:Oligopeptide ABC transporter substrate-binding protein OppA n=1 Tax=Bifidobacterium magnum TaxID=1692 RepID=A0A087BDZ6_9BIFI|nr:ABC transporter substrate-binding protein [Bifidobacterium magnum]KFI69246.1 Oligopeptide ABC transporter substrate-binding protein OppA [Bifidobacterium magnum]
MTHTNGADHMHATDPNTSDGPHAGPSLDPELNLRLKQPRGGVPGRIVALVVALAVIVSFTLAWMLKPSGAAGGVTRQDSVAIGLNLAPTNLDIRSTAGTALDQLLIGNVYEGLLSRNEQNEAVPGLAKSWDVSADGTQYTFALNTGVKFSNGDAMDADDVVWSINELVKHQYHDANQLKFFKSVSAPDSHTVTITLSQPYAQLPWALTTRAGLVFDKDASYNYRTKAIGTGPYVITSFIPNDSVSLTANKHYWNIVQPQTPHITIKYFTDDNAAVNALSSGSIQVLSPITASLAAPFRDNDHYVVRAGDGTDKYVLAMNNAPGQPTANKDVREAIRYAIDTKQLIAARGGADSALGGPIPSLDPGYEDLTGLYPHDVAKARSLLARAGYTKDHPLKLTLTYSNTYGTEIGNQLRSQLKQANIDLTVHVVEFSTWLQQVYTDKNYQLSLVDHNESHDFASSWANPDYYFNYHNQRVQELTEQALSSTSAEESDKLLAQAARIVSEDAAADWLFNYRITTAMDAGVSGFPTVMNQIHMPLVNVVYVK